MIEWPYSLPLRLLFVARALEKHGLSEDAWFQVVFVDFSILDIEAEIVIE